MTVRNGQSARRLSLQPHPRVDDRGVVRGATARLSDELSSSHPDPGRPLPHRRPLPKESEQERAAAEALATFRQDGFGSHDKISRAFVDGEPVGSLTRDSIVDNITLYWLTGTAASAARSYWEDARALAAALGSGQPPPAVKVPVGFTTFPGEIWASPRSWVEAVYPGLAYFNEVEKGGHFAAWEEPQLFSEELRAAFRSLR